MAQEINAIPHNYHWHTFLFTKVNQVHFLLYLHVCTFDTLQMDNEFIHYMSDREQVTCNVLFGTNVDEEMPMVKAIELAHIDQRATNMENLFFFVTRIHKNT